ncbi:hypothetical protein MBLNU457_g0960t1 [Dothideomycetes sp. NU457]
MSTTTSNSHGARPPPASLLTIPPEIREMIYDYLPDAQAFELNPRCKARWRNSSGNVNLLRELEPPELGEVHPLLRAELATRMYSNIRLNLWRTSDTAPFTHWLGNCGDGVLSVIKTITITVSWNYGQPLVFTLGAQPTVALAWTPLRDRGRRFNPEHHATIDHTTYDSGVPHQFRKFAGQLRDAQALALTAMEENMPQHPRYPRRVWTKEAWVVVKGVIFTELSCPYYPYYSSRLREDPRLRPARRPNPRNVDDYDDRL